MEKQKKKWTKPLLIGGIIVAVLALIAGGLLLFTDPFRGAPEAPVQQELQVACDVYWNVDRDQYYSLDSEEIKHRKRSEDGNYWIRVFKNGEVQELMLAEPSLSSSIDASYLMGLVLDENGAILDTVDIKDLPVTQRAWKFYVQGVEGNTVTTNSSYRYDGMEDILVLTENTGVYDMTGVSGPAGTATTLQEDDRIMALEDAEGNLTDVFVYGRMAFDSRVERYCEHCKEEVVWSSWTRENALPLVNGHYFLTSDVQLNAQASIKMEQKICLDLNGHTVTGAENARVYSCHAALVELAIFDYSQEQTGKMVAWGEASAQGGCVWVRYGSFSLYGGTLDGSGVVSNVNGSTVNVPQNAVFNMYGGTIIGGKAVAAVSKTGSISNGMGGAVCVTGTMNMYGGTIRDGYSESYLNKKTSKWHVGYGGNVVVSGTAATFNMYGGQILDGQAEGGGGNVFVVSKGTFNFHDGLIDGGITRRASTQGGNLTVAVNSFCNMHGGVICDGIAPLYGGNVRVDGTMNMVGGSIYGGMIVDQSTGTFKENNTGKNVYFSKGRFNMYGGWVDGSFLCNDAAKDGTQPELYLTGQARIFGADEGKTNLKLGTGNDGIAVTVDRLYGSAKLQVTASGFFTLPTAAANADYFTCDDPSLSVVHTDERLFVGRMGCLCGYDEHIGKCDGSLKTWGAWTNTDSLPTQDGYYYLTANVECKQNNVAEGANVVLDLNGKTVTGKAGGRIYATFNKDCSLTITDSVGGGTIKPQGSSSAQGLGVWVRYGSFTMYGGTLDASQSTTTYATGGCGIYAGNGTSFTLYEGTVIGGTAPMGNAVYVGATANAQICGGTVTGEAYVAGSATVDGTVQAQINVAAGKELTIGELKEGTALFIEGSSTVAVAKGDNLEQQLGKISCPEGLTLRVEAGKLYLDQPASGHVLCKVCGGVYEDCDHTEKVEYAAVTDDLSVINAGGHYYLTQDITGTSQLAITEGKTIVLDLNGHKIEVTNRVIAMNKAANLTITDSVGGGAIVSKTAKKDRGMVINVNNAGASVTLYAGTLDGSGVTNGDLGAAINLVGTFKMYGGTVIGGLANRDGGAFRINGTSAVFEMYDGFIYGGQTKSKGHNIYLGAYKSVIFGGGKIAGGVYASSGTPKVQGDMVIDKALTPEGFFVSDYSLQLTDTRKVSAAGGLEEGARICITLSGSNNVVANNVASPEQAAYFHLDDAECVRTYDEEGKTLTLT